MARTTLTTGACPVCNESVARTVTLHHGLQRETFHCQQHGSLTYGAHDVPLAALSAARTTTYGSPGAPAILSSAETYGHLGLDWVQ